MKKNLLVAQSGGPSAAINATLAGIIREGSHSPEIGRVLGGCNGVHGILEEHIIDLTAQAPKEEQLFLLERTPAMALGSCRVKLPPIEKDKAVYQRLLEIFQKYNIGYFLYIGGNDSMDTAAKLSAYFSAIGEDIRVIGVPKTIDNDLEATDHTPGFGTAAKYIACSMAEIARDCAVYPIPSVTIVEIMGRNAGWLTAAAALPHHLGITAPHLLYLPEQPFSPESFLQELQSMQIGHSSVVVAVSEGIRLENGAYLSEQDFAGGVDAFGHGHLSGAGKVLENLVAERLGGKVRSVELNILQRCSAHLLSQTDLQESRAIGASGVQAALQGKTGEFMVFQRVSNHPYRVEIQSVPVSQVANREKRFPTQWLLPDHQGLTRQGTEYLLPLIEGEAQIPYLNGMPHHFRFNFSQPAIL